MQGWQQAPQQPNEIELLTTYIHKKRNFEFFTNFHNFLTYEDCFDEKH